MNTKSLLAVATAALFVSSLQAQTKFYLPNNTTSTGSCNVIPFGTGTSSTWINQKYQVVVPAATFNKTVGFINTLGFATCNNGTRNFQQLTIKMDYLQGTSMSTTFSNNISSKAVTVMDQKDHTWHMTRGSWVRIGLTTPFRYIPQLGDLVIEVTSRNSSGGSASCRTGNGGTSGGTIPRLYALGSTWSGGNPPASGTPGSSSGLKMELGFNANAIDTYGVGCAGSNNLVPKLTLSGSAALGKNLLVTLSGALPKASTFLVASAQLNMTPVDLQSLNMPGCILNMPLDILLTLGPTDANGAYTLTAGVPKDTALVGFKLYAQYFPWDKNANGLGLSGTNYGRATIGY